MLDAKCSMLDAECSIPDADTPVLYLQGAADKVGGLARMLPGVNALIARIQSHHARDTLIQALVIGSLMFFTIVYWYNKS
jgi:hypothetical protein